MLLAAFVCASIALMCGLGFGQTSSANLAIDSEQSGFSNEIIIVCDDASKKPADAISEAGIDVVGVEDLGAIAGSEEEAFLLTVSEDEDSDAVISEIEQSDDVLYAQPNYTYNLLEDTPTYTIGSFSAVPNDVSLSRQYYLKGWQDSPSASGANVIEAWEQSKAEGAVTVAIIDSGIRPTHSDLEANIDTEHMKDIYHKTEPGIIDDPIGHGTHVAGIIAGVANNEKGIAGVSYNARILPIRVFSDNGTCSSAELLSAFAYLSALVESGELDNLHVVNMSLGDYRESADDRALRSAIGKMRDEHHVLTVCAGGNGDKDTGQPYTRPCWPSDFDECLSVTALTNSGENWSKSDYNLAKDISAPGVSIYSTYHSSDVSYQSMTGTSMATPIVSGTAALLWAHYPELTVDEVVEAITQTAHPLDPAGINYHTPAETGSAGAIDASEALAYVGGTRTHMSDVQADQIGDETYNGVAHMPDVTPTFERAKLIANKDYTVTYIGNVNAGQATMVLRGTGNYVGTKKLSFKILPASLDGAKVKGVVSRVYTGSAQRQAPKVTFALGKGTVNLKSGTDYSLSYKNNVNAGTATMIITGKGNYAGSVYRTFAIGKAKLSSVTLGASRLTYNGKSRTPPTTVKAKVGVVNKTLKKGADFSVSAKNNKNVGTAKLTVVGKGNYTGSITKTYQIIPKGVGLKKVTPGKGQFTVQWYRQSAKMGSSRINGYQIRYSKSKTFESGVKYKTITGYRNLTTKATGLKKGATYYVQVRTFKTVYGKNYFSVWSKSRACKV